MFRIFLSLFISVCFSACYPTSSLGQDEHSQGQGKKQGKYPVFIVTDRQVNETKRGLEFSYQRASKLRYATYQVSDPASDKLNTADVNLLRSKEEFLSALRQTGATRIAVFVHGYRKSFEGSLEFAQRISSKVDIPVVLFAWPSRNKYSAYMIDECTSEWSSHQLADTLKDLGEQFSNQNICVLSHSLGARMVTWSFRILASQNQLKDPFACNLLFSPDMDRDTFLRESAFLNSCASVMKIYLDAHDTRIWLSKMLHGSPRVGTADGSEDNEFLQKTCKFDTSMPNHHIPFTILNAALNHLAGVEAVDN